MKTVFEIKNKSLECTDKKHKLGSGRSCKRVKPEITAIGEG